MKGELMNRKLLAAIVAGSAIVCMGAGVVRASSITVTYNVYNESNDPGSGLALKFTLSMHSVCTDTHSITWAIDQIQIDLYGSSPATWADTSPSPSTWTVTHADVNNPQASEFIDTPTFSGTAAVVSGATSSLDYSFRGSAQDPRSTSQSSVWLLWYMQSGTTTNQSTGQPITAKIP